MFDFITHIKESSDFAALGPATDSQIEDAEKALNVKFSSDYKEYLKAFGAATFENKELTGISQSERLSVISTTQHARTCFANFPTDAYVIEDLLIDHLYIIQDASGSIFSFGPSEKKETIASDLCTYLFPEYSI